jgi:hypothetical protein
MTAEGFPQGVSLARLCERELVSDVALLRERP